MTLKYIIKVIVNPTDNPKLIKDIPKISLNVTPIIIANKWPKKIFVGWANSLSWNTKTIKVVDPKENINQKPVDVSKLKNDRTPIIIEPNIPKMIGSTFFDIFIYIFFYFKLYTLNGLYKTIQIS